MQNSQEHLNNQKMQRKSIQKNKPQQKCIKKDVGKPAGLDVIKLETPKVWSCLNVERQLIEYFTQIGRHVYLSLAGIKKNSQKEGLSDKALAKLQKYQAIYQNKSMYSYIEHIAQSLFNWKCQKLSVVYFFRNDRTSYNKYQKIYLINEKWNQIIKNIKFLLNEQFYFELISILKMFESNYTTEQICDKLIEQSKELDQVPQIIQNFFILLNKEKKIEQQIHGASCAQLEMLKTIYLNSLDNHKDQLQIIIEKLRQIMYENWVPQFIQQYDNVSFEIQNKIFNDDSNLIFQSDKE
ncbi:unnamed protein product [Paramecium primaurelia]|uniref:Uncharacterized protein n=1 Tax=Paramecium primaurelia TaxID=5886 RepID=A0A8S1L7B4_PARPR|nr:unnamed protein product [Paramecium primaurelia]